MLKNLAQLEKLGLCNPKNVAPTRWWAWLKAEGACQSCPGSPYPEMLLKHVGCISCFCETHLMQQFGGKTWVGTNHLPEGWPSSRKCVPSKPHPDPLQLQLLFQQAGAFLKVWLNSRTCILLSCTEGAGPAPGNVSLQGSQAPPKSCCSPKCYSNKLVADLDLGKTPSANWGAGTTPGNAPFIVSPKPFATTSAPKGPRALRSLLRFSLPP